MKVAIIGTVSLHRHLAPFNDPTWEIWGCSPGNTPPSAGGSAIFPRITRWFELHGIVAMGSPECAVWARPYLEWLKQQTFEIWMQEPNEFVPNCKVFPLKALLREFGDLGRLSFTSSVSMMMAFAIHIGVKEIRIYGVDMAADEEAYSQQRVGCQLMMILAKQRGIKVYVPLESCLAQPNPIYGYDEASRMGRRLQVKEAEVIKGINDLAATIERLTIDKIRHEGMLTNLRYVRRTYVDGADAELDLPQVDTEVKQPEFGAFRMGGGGLLVPKDGNGADRFPSQTPPAPSAPDQPQSRVRAKNEQPKVP